MNTPIYLESIDSHRDDVLNIYKILQKTSVRRCTDKMGRAKSFGPHRSMTLGLVKTRITRNFGLSSMSKKNYKLYEALMEFGKTFVPFEFNSIQVNHNVVCPKHIDPNNIGLSVIVSIGDYEGCDLVIENHGTYDIKYKPLVFNGSIDYHYNTPLTSGNKYSFVFFKSI